MKLSGSQVLVADTARRFLEAESSHGDVVSNRRRWALFAEYGWLGGILDEEAGGYGGNVELALLSQEFGAALAPEPWIDAAVSPLAFLSRAALRPAHQNLCSRLISGDLVVTATYVNRAWRGGQIDPGGVRYDSHGKHLCGRLTHLFGVEIADKLLVIAEGVEHASAFLVDVNAPGLTVVGGSSIDGRVLSTLTFDRVSMEDDAQIADTASVASAEAASADLCCLAQCAEIMGIMERMFSMTREYLQVRRQFGQLLSSFQSLRHRLADMYAELLQARAMLWLGVSALGERGPTDKRAALISACKLRILKAAKLIGSQSLQLHGAIALTEELKLGSYFKRLLIAEKRFGDLEFHAARSFELSLRQTEAAYG